MNSPITTTLAHSVDTPPAVAREAGASAGTSATILKATFTIVPVVAGLDKFTNLLTHWEHYLNPALAQALPVSPHVLMEMAGIVEVAAGMLVFFRPRLGALIVSAWLTCIALSLLAGGQYLDVAVRDLVMAVSAYALSQLAPSGSGANERLP